MNVYINRADNYSDMQGPAPDGFHVPLSTEWQAIHDAGVSLGAWDSSNGTNLSTYLKLPMAGYRSYTNPGTIGAGGCYWSSSPYFDNANPATFLFFNESSIIPKGSGYRSYGRSLRCLKNYPVIPTASWTKLYGTSIESGGIFHNATEGLISISSDGSTWYTLMDKNLGATTVYNYGDTLTDANCGNVFQWGNNYAFPGTLSSDSITTSDTRVDVTGYGPGNYYESSTWITLNPRQSSDDAGNNLRGGVTGVGGESELKNAYIGEVWTPNANTIAYFPFVSDTLDQMGNYTLSSSGTKQTVGYSFSSSTTVSGVSDYSKQKFTSYWINFSASDSSAVLIGVGGFRLNNRTGGRSYAEFVFKDSGGTFHNLGNNGINNSTWYHVAYGWDGTTYKTYVNGVLKNSGTSTPYQYSECWIVGGTNGVILSEVIFESAIWSATEIQNYYNLTKSNYGIS